MYLRELHVQNVKLLRDFRLSFLRDGEPRMWTVLIGENGLCKTTVLQAIALAASGPDRANQLADVPSLPDVRHTEQATSASAEFELTPGMHKRRSYPGLGKRRAKPPRLYSNLSIKPKWKVFDGESRYEGIKRKNGDNPLREARAEGLPHWFVAGYGTGRIGVGSTTSDSDKDPVLGRLDSLFDKGRSPGPEGFVLPKQLAHDYADMLLTIFTRERLLPRAAMTAVGLTENERSVANPIFDLHLGRQSLLLTFSALSQGYRATASWIIDLVGQLITDAQANILPRSAEGLVLIDEIDLHLHPQWQVELIPTLKNLFPRMQFVVTTHSPMVLPGLERDEVVILSLDADGNVVAKEPPQSPALMTGSEIYDTFFGLHSLYPKDLGDKLRRYGFLVGNPARGDEEEAEMQDLRNTLEDHGVDPGWTPVPRGTTLEDDDEVIP